MKKEFSIGCCHPFPSYYLVPLYMYSSTCYSSIQYCNIYAFVPGIPNAASRYFMCNTISVSCLNGKKTLHLQQNTAYQKTTLEFCTQKMSFRQIWFVFYAGIYGWYLLILQSRPVHFELQSHFPISWSNLPFPEQSGRHWKSASFLSWQAAPIQPRSQWQWASWQTPRPEHVGS